LSMIIEKVVLCQILFYTIFKIVYAGFRFYRFEYFLILLPFLYPITKYIIHPIKGIRAITPHINLYASLPKSFLAISNIAKQVIT